VITPEVKMKILKIYCLLFVSSQHAEKAGVLAHYTVNCALAVPHICQCLYSEYRHNVWCTNNNKSSPYVSYISVNYLICSYLKTYVGTIKTIKLQLGS